jgi:hypothetical protein
LLKKLTSQAAEYLVGRQFHRCASLFWTAPRRSDKHYLVAVAYEIHMPLIVHNPKSKRRNSMLNRRFSVIRRPLSTAGAFAKTLQHLLIAVLLIVVLGTALPQPTQAEPAVASGDVSPGGLLNPDGTLNMSTGFQGTLDLRGWQVTLDGKRGPILDPASLSDSSQANAWNALPNQGLDDLVLSLAVLGDDLYVGGLFTQTGDGTLTDLGHIARYDTIAGVWHALPNQGLNDHVHSLAVLGNDLYVGGKFKQTGDGTLTDLGRIARYDTIAGVWHALPNQGLNDWVLTLAVSGDDLYVGGNFTYLTQPPGGVWEQLGRIARYDTITGTWHALANQGLNLYVYSLAVLGDDLYVGGYFTETKDGALTDLGHIARYDTTYGAWHALPNQGLNLYVHSLAVSGDDLYVGGEFSQTGDGALTDLGYIARYDTSAVSETYVYLPLVVK